MTKGALLLGRIGLVLFAVALAASIAFEIITKDFSAAWITDKVIWAVFGFILGSGVYGRRRNKAEV